MPSDNLPPNWPAMPIAQANALLAGPGSPLELEDAVIRGVPMKVYKNAPPNIPMILDLAAQQFAERTYLVYQNERVTFRALYLAVRKLAAEMRDKYGRKKGGFATIYIIKPHTSTAGSCTSKETFFTFFRLVGTRLCLIPIKVGCHRHC